MRQKFEIALAAYAEGGTIKSALKSAGMCSGDFYKFLAANPQDKARYYTVQEARADMMVDEAYELSTDSEIDPRRARVQSEIRLKIAATYDRARFGDRVDVNVRGQVDMVAAIADARARINRPATDPARIIEAQCVDVAAPLAIGASATVSDAIGDFAPVADSDRQTIFD